MEMKIEVGSSPPVESDRRMGATYTDGVIEATNQSGADHSGDHECRGDAFAGGIANDQRQTVTCKGHEIIAVAAEGSNLVAASAADHRIAGPTQTLHKAPRHIAS